jgi:hypothetical protein
MTIIWNILAKPVLYSTMDYLTEKFTEHTVVIYTKAQRLKILCNHGYFLSKTCH